MRTDKVLSLGACTHSLRHRQVVPQEGGLAGEANNACETVACQQGRIPAQQPGSGGEQAGEMGKAVTHMCTCCPTAASHPHGGVSHRMQGASMPKDWLGGRWPRSSHLPPHALS